MCLWAGGVKCWVGPNHFEIGCMEGKIRVVLPAADPPVEAVFAPRPSVMLTTSSRQRRGRRRRMPSASWRAEVCC